MKFFLDHDVPVDVARVLRLEGHEVVELREALPVTASDAEALHHAAARNFVLVTCNRDDFLALVISNPNPGLIILIHWEECPKNLEVIEPCKEVRRFMPASVEVVAKV